MVIGLFKRLKNVAKHVGNFVEGLNTVYKQVAPVLDSALGFVPFGGAISQGMRIASNIVDHGGKAIRQARRNRMIDSEPVN